MINCLSRRDQKVHLIFQKLCLSRHQGLLFKWFQNEKEAFIEMDLLPTVITNSFQIQNQTFEKKILFSFFFNDFMIMKIIPF